jgi:serine/threonine protein kinase
MDLSAYDLDEEVKIFLKSQKDFLIDRVSQEGGNCDMFFGYHKIFESRIALKVYYGTEKSNSHNEARILSKIDHPNILRVRDAKRIGDFYSYFMTDEINGGDLEKYFLNEKLDLKENLKIVHGILNGLTELHRDGVSILHRDLKPKNILLYEETRRPLIADFGSIKHFEKEIGGVTGSKTTLVYTPKEVFDNNTYTKQSDIYQVGVIMFQILGGYFPGAYVDWLSEKENNKLKQVIGHYEQSVYIDKVIQKLVTKNNLLKFDFLPKYVNPKIVKIIQKATHPKLNVRYSNTGEFMSDLFNVQKRLINWKVENNNYSALTTSGEQFRVMESRKGYYTEKLGISGWRLTGAITNDLDSHIISINSLKS